MRAIYSCLQLNNCTFHYIESNSVKALFLRCVWLLKRSILKILRNKKKWKHSIWSTLTQNNVSSFYYKRNTVGYCANNQRNANILPMICYEIMVIIEGSFCYTLVHHGVMQIHSEKCVVSTFLPCVSMVECMYTNLDDIAY